MKWNVRCFLSLEPGYLADQVSWLIATPPCQIEKEDKGDFRAPMSPSLCCMTIYKREKRSTSCFGIDIFPACLLVLGLRCWTSEEWQGILLDCLMYGTSAVLDDWFVVVFVLLLAKCFDSADCLHHTLINDISCVKHQKFGSAIKDWTRFRELKPSSWCFCWFTTSGINSLSNSFISRACSGPAVIYFLHAVSPTAPPEPLLFCSLLLVVVLNVPKEESWKGVPSKFMLLNFTLFAFNFALLFTLAATKYVASKYLVQKYRDRRDWSLLSEGWRKMLYKRILDIMFTPGGGTPPKIKV